MKVHKSAHINNYWTELGPHLDHSIANKVVLKPFQLELKNGRKVDKEHTFPSVLALQRKRFSRI